MGILPIIYACHFNDIPELVQVEASRQVPVDSGKAEGAYGFDEFQRLFDGRRTEENPGNVYI